MPSWPSPSPYLDNVSVRRQFITYSTVNTAPSNRHMSQSPTMRPLQLSTLHILRVMMSRHLGQLPSLIQPPNSISHTTISLANHNCSCAAPLQRTSHGH